MCTFFIPQCAESEGEVSQFDSLDNCSDGGMSTENFNTLKKGPLALIDPPPEFQVKFYYAQEFIYVYIQVSTLLYRIPHKQH